MNDFKTKKITKIKINSFRKSLFFRLKNRNTIKRILKKEFLIPTFENTMYFKNSINNSKDFKKLKKVCRFFDCQFKILNNRTVELIY